MRILLIEDAISDAMLTGIALQKTSITHRLHTCRNGDEAMRLLAQLWHNREPLPDVIMLDLGLPGSDGFEIMEQLGAMSPCIRAIPIIILTGHQHFEYACKTHKLWIPAYFHKPCEPMKMREILNAIRAVC